MEFKVYGYDISDKDYGIRSVGSFKLDLRSVCKENPLYFKPVSGYVRNLGQLLFGVPNRWKGLFTMKIEREDEERREADIVVSLDHRAFLLFPDEISDLIRLIKSGLDVLQKEGIIKSYEEVRK